MAQKFVFVTGFAQLDAKLRTLEPKLQKKFARKALRNSAKLVVRDAKRIVRSEASDTRAFEQSITSRSLKRSRKRIGVGVHIDKNKLFMRRAKKTGDVIRAAGFDLADQYYYPASIEFGWIQRDGTFHQPVKPMRRALYDNERAVKAFFEGDVRQMIRENQQITVAV